MIKVNSFTDHDLFNNHCDVCNSESCFIISINGISNFWGKSINSENIHAYRIKVCTDCGFCVNLDYSQSNFYESGYNNISTEALSLAEIALISAINSLFNNNTNELIHWIEIGAGRKINHIVDLFQTSGIVKKVSLIDPIYKSESVTSSILKCIPAEFDLNINSITSERSDINLTKIIAFRNSAEYFSLDEVKVFISDFFSTYNDAYFIFEITSLPSIQDCMHIAFTEYLNFYSLKSLFLIFSNLQIFLNPLLTIRQPGENRSIYLCKASKLPTNLIRTFFSEDDLINALIKHREFNTESRIVLWGSGARNILFMMNNGDNLIDEIIDMSLDRVGVSLSNKKTIKSIDILNPNDAIVCLNSSFIEKLHSLTPKLQKFLYIRNDSC